VEAIAAVLTNETLCSLRKATLSNDAWTGSPAKNSEMLPRFERGSWRSRKMLP
jgi:hypothetical protein